jgi:hypothetical protein
MADHRHLALDQKAKVVLSFAEENSVTATHRKFRYFFGTRWGPARNIIHRMSQQFELEGSVEER